MIKEVFSSDVISLRDLLELLQGPVPMTGAIIIATTNKYEECKQMCPELFRAGRLTPIYCGNFNSEMIDIVSEHHFGQKIGLTSKSVSICPAQIMLKVSEFHRDTLEGFDKFKHYVQDTCIEASCSSKI